MSIIASVKVYDGLAVAADSMTQILGVEQDSGRLGVVKQYQYARKVFQLSGLPIVVASYGIGNIGSRSIESLLLEFSKTKISNINETKGQVEPIAELLLKFFLDKYNSAYSNHSENEKPLFGFYVGGYSPDSPFAEDWEFIFPQLSSVREVRPKGQFGASWRGVSVPFIRLYRGIDPRIEDILREQEVSEELLTEIHTAVESPIIFDGMPIQDAIDLAKFIVSTTIGLARFEAGPQSCGGPIDVAVVLPGEDTNEFRWIQRKEFGVNYEK